jgi:hypothetical protein
MALLKKGGEVEPAVERGDSLPDFQTLDLDAVLT